MDVEGVTRSQFFFMLSREFQAQECLLQGVGLSFSVVFGLPDGGLGREIQDHLYLLLSTRVEKPLYKYLTC